MRGSGTVSTRTSRFPCQVRALMGGTSFRSRQRSPRVPVGGAANRRPARRWRRGGCPLAAGPVGLGHTWRCPRDAGRPRAPAHAPPRATDGHRHPTGRESPAPPTPSPAPPRLDAAHARGSVHASSGRGWRPGPAQRPAAAGPYGPGPQSGPPPRGVGLPPRRAAGRGRDAGRVRAGVSRPTEQRRAGCRRRTGRGGRESRGWARVVSLSDRVRRRVGPTLPKRFRPMIGMVTYTAHSATLSEN